MPNSTPTQLEVSIKENNHFGKKVIFHNINDDLSVAAYVFKLLIGYN